MTRATRANPDETRRFKVGSAWDDCNLQVNLGLKILRPFLALLQNRVEYVPLWWIDPLFFCLFKYKHYCLPKQNQRAFAGCLFTHSFTKRWLRAGNQVLKAFFFLVVVALCRDSRPLLSFIQIGTGFERLWILSRLHFLESMFSI